MIHGGPDFDRGYLLPGLDSLSKAFRLFYYDQGGRGRSAANVNAADVTLASDVADIERVQEHFELDQAVVIGHSWGAVLALEYAIRHPARVSHLILLKPAPVSTSDLATVREEYEALMATMRNGFLIQGSHGILKARAVEDRLMKDTWERPDYDLLPKLRGFAVPTLVVAGDHDFMLSAAQCIAQAAPAVRLVTIKDCGHFPFLECPSELIAALNSFFRQ